jgi:hypothetical protein
LAAVACLFLFAGCGPDPATSKQQSSSGVPRIATPPKRTEITAEPEPEKPPEPPPPPTKQPIGPWLELQIGGGAVIEGKSYLKLVATPGYNSALQLTSYDAPEHEDFPSLYIRALTPAKTLAELVGKKLPARLYIAADKDGTIIHDVPAPPMEIVVTEIDGKNIRGSFAGHARDVDSGGPAAITGKFQAIIE